MKQNGIGSRLVMDCPSREPPWEAIARECQVWRLLDRFGDS